MVNCHLCKVFQKTIEHHRTIGYNDLHNTKTHFQGGVKVPTGGTARERFPGRDTADPVRFRSRQYSLDERRC